MSTRPWDGAHHQNANSGNGVEHCARCGKALKDDDMVMLELNSADGLYRRESDVPFPAEESQGWFAFGATCARRTMAEQNAALAARE